MEIPNSEIVKKDKKEKISVFYYGEPMIGKTTAADTFPVALFFNTDGNVQNVKRDVFDLMSPKKIILFNKDIKGILHKKEVTLSKWQLFQSVVVNAEVDSDFIEKIKKANFKTVVVDVIDHLYDWCREYHLKRKGLNDESEDQFWAVSNDIKKDFRDFIVRFIDIMKPHFNVVLTGFSSLEEYQEGLEKKSRNVPALKTVVENSKNQDKHRVMERITSKLDIYGCVYMQSYSKEKEGTQGEKEIKEIRVFSPISSKDHYGGNRFGISKLVTPKYDSIIKAIEEN